MSGPGGGFFGLFGDTSGQVSPADVVDLLRARASTVTFLDHQTIDGVGTTRYRALIPPAGLGVPASDLQKIERSLGVTSVAVDFSTDAQSRLRRMSLHSRPTTSSTAAGSSPRLPLTFEATPELSDYGVKVTVVAPATGQIGSQGTCISTADGFNCTTSSAATGSWTARAVRLCPTRRAATPTNIGLSRFNRGASAPPARHSDRAARCG